mmetsp:Transcript_901/g.1407  ORF Transcript_901/g.1407 Transcript_901/m.1407 type:complete len:158 (-) Transcript_901:18-491(-)
MLLYPKEARIHGVKQLLFKCVNCGVSEPAMDKCHGGSGNGCPEDRWATHAPPGDKVATKCVNCCASEEPRWEDRMENDVCVRRKNVNYVEVGAIMVNPDRSEDPTLGVTNEFVCPGGCPSKQAVFYKLSEQQSMDAMALIFVCKQCGKWRKEGKEED